MRVGLGQGSQLTSDFVSSMTTLLTALLCRSGSHPNWWNMLFTHPGSLERKSGRLALDVFDLLDLMLVVRVQFFRGLLEYRARFVSV